MFGARAEGLRGGASSSTRFKALRTVYTPSTRPGGEHSPFSRVEQQPLAGGEMVSQGSLEPLFQVRILARQPIDAVRIARLIAIDETTGHAHRAAIAGAMRGR